MDAVNTLNSDAVPPSSTDLQETHPRRQRRGAAVFVIVFLIATLVLLTLNRACVGTPFMNWYLYQVARQTAWTLGIIGHSGALEDPTLYRDRAASVRANIREWQGIKPEPGDVPNLAAENAPLTGYEIWLFRASRLKHDYQTELEQIALTDPVPQPEVRQPADELRYLQACLSLIKRSIERHTPTGTVQLAAPNIQESIKNSDDTIKSLQESPDAMQQQALDSLRSQIESARTQQHDFLQARADQLFMQVHERMGPIVDFVYTPSVDTGIREIQHQLDLLKGDAPVSEGVAKQRADLEAKLADLQSKHQQQAASVAPPVKELRFRFNVVPDCGALSTIAIYLAALLAFPTQMWKRALGLLVGAPILYVVNIARLTCLAIIGAWTNGGEVFQFAHEYVWQGIYILFVVAVWLLWIELIVQPRSSWQANSQ